MGTFRKKLTEAEIEIKKEKQEKLKNLFKTVQEMTNEQLEQFVSNVGIVTCEGHALSPRNQVLLVLQAENDIMPSIVGGYAQWQKQNRQVKKGEKSKLSILVPMTIKEKNEQGQVIENSEDVTFFKWVSVFDILQTEEQGELINA